MTTPTANQPARPRRRWYQFSLRSVLAFVTLVVLGLVAWRSYVEPYRHERQVMKLIEDLGGRYSTETHGPAWLAKIFGSEHFQAVTFVDLADCDEPQRYLPAISRCPWLEVLMIGGNEVGDETVASLHRLKCLKGLVLDSTAASDSSAEELQNALPDLTVHKSQRRAIAGFRAMRETGVATRPIDRPTVFPAFIGEEHFEVAVRIYVNDLTRSELTDDKLALVRLFTDLEGFGVLADRTGKFTDAGVQNLATLRKLKDLSLRGGQITEQGLRWLERKANLEELTLQIALTDDGLRRLPLKGLRMLCLVETKVTDAGLEALRECAELRRLALVGGNVSDNGLAGLEALTMLEHLKLDFLQITNASLAHIAKLERLETLSLVEARITNDAIGQLKGLTDLRLLVLDRTMIDAEGLRHLRALPKLEMLRLGNVSGKSRIDNAAAAELAKLKGLKELFVDGANITDGGLELLQRGLPNLQTLSVGETEVTAPAVTVLRKVRPKMNVDFWPRQQPAAKTQ